MLRERQDPARRQSPALRRIGPPSMRVSGPAVKRGLPCGPKEHMRGRRIHSTGNVTLSISPRSRLIQSWGHGMLARHLPPLARAEFTCLWVAQDQRGITIPWGFVILRPPGQAWAAPKFSTVRLPCPFDLIFNARETVNRCVLPHLFARHGGLTHVPESPG